MSQNLRRKREVKNQYRWSDPANFHAKKGRSKKKSLWKFPYCAIKRRSCGVLKNEIRNGNKRVSWPTLPINCGKRGNSHYCRPIASFRRWSMYPKFRDPANRKGWLRKGRDLRKGKEAGLVVTIYRRDLLYPKNSSRSQQPWYHTSSYFSAFSLSGTFRSQQ